MAATRVIVEAIFGPEGVVMSSKQSSTTEAQTLLTGLAMGESPRWHDNRLWFSDWGAQEIIAVDRSGNSEVVVRTSFGLPFCIDWLPDGRLLIVSGREGLRILSVPGIPDERYEQEHNRQSV